MKTTHLGTRIWWPITFGLALVAVAYLRVAGAQVMSPMNWMERQSHDLSVAALDSPIRYVCVNGIAYDLGEQGPINLMEDTLVLDYNAARAKCTLPYIPHLNNAKILLVATSPDSGYGASFMSVHLNQFDALEKLAQQLERVGWHQKAAPGAESASTPARMFQRKDAWILTVATSFDPVKKETKILLAGNFDPELMR